MIETITSRKGISLAEDYDVNFIVGLKTLQKFTKRSRSSGPCGFFKTTHEEASHAGCHFGTHAGSEHLLVVLASKVKLL